MVETPGESPEETDAPSSVEKAREGLGELQSGIEKEIDEAGDALEEELSSQGINDFSEESLLKQGTEILRDRGNDWGEKLALIALLLFTKGFGDSFSTADYNVFDVDDGDDSSEAPMSDEDLNPYDYERNSDELSEQTQRLLSVSQNMVGSTAFRGVEVNGGNLACAQVASTALTRAGYLDRPHLGVNSAEAALIAKGWTVVEGAYAQNPQPGDVIIWNLGRTGHRHMGIAMGNGVAMSNSSKQKMPRLHNTGEIQEAGQEGYHQYWSDRGIQRLLIPPTSND